MANTMPVLRGILIVWYACLQVTAQVAWDVKEKSMEQLAQIRYGACIIYK